VKLDPARIERLREQLLERGARSLSPRAFSGRSPQVAAAYERVRPFAEAMFMVMSADGAITEHERGVLRGAVRILTEDQLGGEATDRMLAEFEASWASQGRAEGLDRLASELWAEPEDRQLAVALVATMAAADARLDPAESGSIIELAERLGLKKQAEEALALS
jgi:uncharacterized tellurite resistance protein B-like protein